MPGRTPTREQLARRIAAAQGEVECDLLIENVRYLDVFSCCFRHGDVAICDGKIIGLGSRLPAKRSLKGAGKTLVPGFIDAHVHVESSMMLPNAFESAVLRRGTTSAVCDPHEIANVVGPRGIEMFLRASSALSMDLWVMMSSCVPSAHLETNGGGNIDAEALELLARHPRALGLAEVMSFRGVLGAQTDLLDKLLAFGGRPVDGHAPLLRGEELSAYAAAGISSCHESSELDEAQEKLTKGIAVWIREGSVAKDLDALTPLLSLATSTSVGFCTDDRNPYDIAEEGHIDFLLRRAIANGVPEEVAYRSASWSVARHYGLASGSTRVGAVAPGYQADLVLLDDPATCDVRTVLKAGRLASELEPSPGVETELAGTVRARVPESADLEGPSGPVHVIRVLPGKIITGREVLAHDAPGVRRLTVLERHGHERPPANAYVIGFGELRGAIASSVGHDSHNLIVIGDSPADMRAALGALIESGGGFSVAQGGDVKAHLPLPHGGLMSDASPESLRGSLAELREASGALGCELADPFLQLAFLSLPVIPTLKLTDHGLVDVERLEVIAVRAA